MKAPVWLGGTLIVGPKMALCLSEKEWLAKLAEIKCETTERWVNPGAHATTHFFDASDGGTASVICLNAAGNWKGTHIAALLVHEAVHVWQAYRKHIGEQEPSAEFEAYAIQSLTQSLFDAYSKRIRKATK